jgi:hypothetical protein
MPRPYENPLSGEPHTVETQDAEGKPVFTITARELTPGRARAASALGGVAGLCLAAGVPFGLIETSSLDPAHIAAAVAAALVGHRAVSYSLTQALYRTTVIVMSTAAIAVRGRYRLKRYARDVAHQFQLVPHDLTREEQRAQTVAQQRASREGKVYQPAVYYGESFHVALAYAGQRIDLLTVYRAPRAAAVVARLQLCDELLNRASGKNHNTGGGAEEEWSRPAPGGLS